MDTLIHDIHHLFRMLQLKYRSVRKHSGIHLTLAEIHTLVELHAGPVTSVNNLVRALAIPQSQCSRLVSRLQRRALLRLEPSPEDRRKRAIVLTTKGMEATQAIDRVIGGVFGEFAAGLSGRERKELAAFFEKIVAGYGLPPARARRGESRLRAQHRQVTRALGLLGTNVYGSGLTRSEWCILESVCLASEPIIGSQLERHLLIKPNLISVIVGLFEKRGLVSRIRSSENHRMRPIVPTKKGRTYFEKIKTRAVVRLHQCLQGTSRAELIRQRDLLRRFAGEWSSGNSLLSHQFLLKSLEDPAERREARGFALRESVQRGWEDSVPDPVFPAGHEVWAVFSQRDGSPQLQAVCCAQRTDRKWYVNFCAWSREFSVIQMHVFIREAHTLSSARQTPTDTSITYAPMLKLLEDSGVSSDA